MDKKLYRSIEPSDLATPMDNKIIGAAKIRQGAAKKVAIKKKVDVKKTGVYESSIGGRQIDAGGSTLPRFATVNNSK